MTDPLLALSFPARRTFCRLVVQDLFPSTAGDALREGEHPVNELLKAGLFEKARADLYGVDLRLTDMGRRAWRGA